MVLSSILFWILLNNYFNLIALRQTNNDNQLFWLYMNMKKDINVTKSTTNSKEDSY